MLRLLIVDDEAPARQRLRRMLERAGDVDVVGEAASGDAALSMIGECGADALLLDISMPGLDGMALARRLAAMDRAPAVVFCTAHADQALDAFDSDAIDYLLKPVRQERLESALDKVRRVVGTKDESEAMLRTTVGTRTELIPLARVICLLAEDKYTTVHHDRGKAVIALSLVELEQAHADQLLRVHRSALVARERIRGLQRGDDGVMHVTLSGSDMRPAVSRRKLPEIRRVIKELT